MFVINLLVATWSAIVFWALWWAFVVPLGAPVIGFFHAAGLALFYTFMAAVLLVRRDQMPVPEEIERMAVVRATYLAEIMVLGAVCKTLMVLGG